MSVVFSDFGVTPDGRRVLRAEIANGELKAAVISYGAALAALEVPCGDVAIDVALGYDRLEDYIAGTGCLGGTPGRCANRIARRTTRRCWPAAYPPARLRPWPGRRWISVKCAR